MIESLQKKRPDASVYKFSNSGSAGVVGGFDNVLLEEMLFGANLFAPKNIIVLDGLLGDKNTEEYISSRVSDLANSEHVCFILETKINKENLKKLEKSSEKIEEHNVVVPKFSYGSFGSGSNGASAGGGASGSASFSETFSFADAVVNKDRKRAWTIFQHLLAQGLAAEEIHGVLWWQFKSVFLATKYKGADEAGVKPNVFKNCQNFAKKWGEDELDLKLDKLVSMYHKAHRGEVDFLAELEVLCLG